MDAAITRDSTAAVQVPLVRLQLAAAGSQAAAQQQQHGSDGSWDREQRAAVAAEPAAAAEDAPVQQQSSLLQQQDGCGAYHLLPLLEGKLLLGLLLDGSTQLTSQLLAQLHALLAGPARQLAAQVRS